MNNNKNNHNSILFDTKTMETPLLSSSSSSSPLSQSSSFTSPSNTSSRSLTSDSEDPQKTTTTKENDDNNNFEILEVKTTTLSHADSLQYKSLTVLSDHSGTVSCLAVCGEFLLSASTGDDIIVWQQPDLKPYAKFGHGDGSVKALIASGNRVFTAHQDSRIRVWKLSSKRSSENVFRLVETLPTKKDYLGKFMSQRNYVQTRRHHKKLWIEHSDSISCLAISNGLVYSGSWDKTIKVWRVSDLKCLESIKAHDDAINGLVSSRGGLVYSASADGKIKAWKRDEGKTVNNHSNNSNGNVKTCSLRHSLEAVLEGRNKDVSVNAVVVSEDGKWVFGGASDGHVRVWERRSESWALVSEVRGHERAVLSLCLVGEYLCSGSADKSIRVWKRMAFGEICKVGVVLGHQGPVKCLATNNGVGFGGAGFLLYSGALDKSLRVWWVPTKKEEEVIH